MDALRQEEEKIRSDQGFHECEVSCQGEFGLQNSLIDCSKSKDHKEYIPVKDFGIEHLPPQYRDDDIVECVRATADIVVRVCTEGVSTKRPKNYPDSDEPYPFYNSRGKKCTRTGSGWLTHVLKSGRNKKTETRSTETCQCEVCKHSDILIQEWGEIQITSANHVCFDDFEVAHTICELFYDSDEDKTKVRRLQGAKIRTDMEKDWCLITCYTHDMELLGQLQRMWHRRTAAQSKLHQKYKKPSLEHPLAVIVSHPHGCIKQVSIGDWTERNEVGKLEQGIIQTWYKYTSSTCRGSSGAPVYTLGKGYGWLIHPHKGYCEDGCNRSGVWRDKIYL